MNEHPQNKKYEISLSRENGKIAVASTHGSTLRMSLVGNEPELGLTPPEAVIAAYGACIMSNINKVAQAESIQIDDVRIDFTAQKRNDPLGLEQIHCTISVKSPAPKDKLQQLLTKATTDGTATNALKEGLKADFQFKV
jgi:uncharacterized OsmC-like protein